MAEARVGSERAGAAWLDLAAVVSLVAVAVAVRHHFPTDGLFYDDAWQALAVTKGSLGNLPLVGQSQPGFALSLIGWRSVTGASATALVGPALLAGILGPPLLYWFLRRCQAARPTAWLLGALLVGSTVHILYSTRVKSYTSDLILMLATTLVVGRVARWRWDRRTMVGWVAGTALVASFSSIAMLAMVAAGLIVVLHPNGDRRARITAVAAQGVAHALLVAVTSQQLNARLVSGFFRSRDGFLRVDPNPISTGRDVLTHLGRVVEVYPGLGGPPALQQAIGLVALGGLALAAWRGPLAVRARFLGVALLMAMAGSVARVVPFGPEGLSTNRITLWLVPALAMGLATVIERGRRALVASSAGLRRGVDAALVAAAVAVLISSDNGLAYPRGGAADATALVVEQRRAGDAVWLTRPSTFSFALASGLPVDLEPTPERAIGFLPEFEDPSVLSLPDFEVDQTVLDASLQGRTRVWVMHAVIRRGPGPPAEQLAALGAHLEGAGFDRARSTDAGSTTVDLWVRSDPEEAP